MRPEPSSPEVFDYLAGVLRRTSGLALTPDQEYLLENRLAPLLRWHGLRDLACLADRLRGRGPSALLSDVVEAMTTNETLFFRDRIPFDDLRTRVLPGLARSRGPDAPVRIWSAAAASGQEAYSVAMLVAESGSAIGAERIEILGTDIARAPLAQARRGLYSDFEVRRGLPKELLARHFRAERRGWRISPALRRAVTFREWNLLSDLGPLGRFDVVLCRNVLIYFDHSTKMRVLTQIAQQMARDGVLYLGGAETVLGLSDRFVPVPSVTGVFALQAPGDHVRG